MMHGRADFWERSFPHFVDDREKAKTAWRAPLPATEQHDGPDDEHDQGQAEQDDLHSSDDQGGYLLSFTLYTPTTSVITPSGRRGAVNTFYTIGRTRPPLRGRIVSRTTQVATGAAGTEGALIGCLNR